MAADGITIFAADLAPRCFSAGAPSQDPGMNLWLDLHTTGKRYYREKGLLPRQLASRARKARAETRSFPQSHLSSAFRFALADRRFVRKICNSDDRFSKI